MAAKWRIIGTLTVISPNRTGVVVPTIAFASS
jgi:hypothetical protein